MIGDLYILCYLHLHPLTNSQRGFVDQGDCDLDVFEQKHITNLACDELMMKIMQYSFIHRFVHFTHEYHALKTCLMYG
jgi:hypothetical protein